MTTLDTIPPELLARICSYIPAKDVLTKFVLVCKRFHVLFGNEDYWRSRLMHFDPSLAFPVSQNHLGYRSCPKAFLESYSISASKQSFRWAKTCAAVESEQKRWSKADKKFREVTLTDGHIATVDTVHLMQDGRLCISGSHDRCLCVWDISRLTNSADEAASSTSKDCLLFTEQKGHVGWIWSIASLGDIVYTGAWDQRIREWRLTPTELRPLSIMSCTAAVLCLVAQPDSIIASTFDRQVKIFDRRNVHELVTTLTYHTRPVLGLATDEDGRYIYSCSEDKTVACFDRRAAGVVHTTRLPDYGTALSYNDGQLWVGTAKGVLHLLCASDWSTLTTYDIGTGKRVTDIKHNDGCIVSASHVKNANIRVTTAGLRPRQITELGSVNQEPTKMDYRYGILACGYVDSNVRLWIPVDSDE